MNRCYFLLTAILAVSPLGVWGCNKANGVRDDAEWWKHAVIYEIYPQSFWDSDGDGFGDLKGIGKKAPYLSELGIDAIWINPIYESPQKENGYDISDFTKIDRRYGTMEDFEDLVKELDEYCIKVIMDFVPNHTSNEHEWFKKSVNKEDPYTDYYVWRDPREWINGYPQPPNNWESVFASYVSSGWMWNDERQQFYFHAFLAEQPDLNYRNPEVLEEMKKVLKFWIGKGVKGFRVDAVPHLVEDAQFRDEFNGHYHTQNQPESYEVVKALRKTLDEYSPGSQQIAMMVEAYAGRDETLRYYGDEENPGAHFPFNFLLLTDFHSWTNAYSLKNVIDTYLNSLKPHQFPNWVSGNHDWPRIPSRLGASTTVDQINVLNLLLPGTSTVYMGDEIGMDSYWSLDKNKCPPGVGDDFRTPGRTPFHWSSDRNAGFTKNHHPWIPINPEYYRLNVESQRCTCHTTHLNTFKKLVRMKSNLSAFTKGEFKTHAMNEDVLVLTWADSGFVYVAMLNLNSAESDNFNLRSIEQLKSVSRIYRVEAMSVNMESQCENRYDCYGNVFSEDGWRMPPKSALCLSFQTYNSENNNKLSEDAEFDDTSVKQSGDQKADGLRSACSCS